MNTLKTKRLVLRQWREQDRKPFAAMNADPEVMTYFPDTLSRVQSDELVDRLHRHIDENGWGAWAAERQDTGQFIGLIGISQCVDGLPFAPCVEVAWRLASDHWHQGFATEGAEAALAYAFDVVGLDEVVSMTAVSNAASEAVMRKIGMQRAANTFAHPALPVKHELSEHVLYRIQRAAWCSD